MDQNARKRIVAPEVEALESENHNINITPGQWNHYFKFLSTDHTELLADTLQKAVSGDPTDKAMNIALQNLEGLKPESHLETLLITQMLQVHGAAAACTLSAFADGQTVKGRELHAKLATKFHRTFVAQIEALQKLRGKGGQRVVVEHVTVQAGGQAVVGNVTRGGG